MSESVRGRDRKLVRVIVCVCDKVDRLTKGTVLCTVPFLMSSLTEVSVRVLKSSVKVLLKFCSILASTAHLSRYLSAKYVQMRNANDANMLKIKKFLLQYMTSVQSRLITGLSGCPYQMCQ